MFCSLQNICRLCGNKTDLLIGVFSPEGEALTLERKIRMCLPITVSAEDDMPKQVCHACVQKLETSYELYLACNSAQTTIKRLMKLQNSSESSSSASKTCFIEQCERERKSRKESTNNIRSLSIHVSSSPFDASSQVTEGNLFPNRNCFIEPGPLHTRVPSPNSMSMPISVFSVPQSSTNTSPAQPPLNKTLSNRSVVFFDLCHVGQIKTVPTFQMLSKLQSVGQIKPLHQVPKITQVVGANGTEPDINNSLTEPIDSKENILLNNQTNKTNFIVETNSTKSASLNTAHKISPAAEVAVQTRELVETIQSSINSNITEPVIAVCNTDCLDKNSAKAVAAVGTLINQNDGTCDKIDIYETSVSKRPRLTSSDVEVICKYCGKTFSEDVINMHQNLHLRVKFFSCVVCDKNFTTEIGLNKHKCGSEPVL